VEYDESLAILIRALKFFDKEQERSGSLPAEKKAKSPEK